MPRLTQAAIRPFGVNPAPAERHAEYAGRLGLPFALLSDPELALARAYGAVHPGAAGVSRSVVLVARGGTVRFARPGAPPMDLVLATLEER
jgi:peroxiredoxin